MEIKGYTYGYDARRNALRSAAALHSLEKLYETGINWLSFAVVIKQKRFNSTEIFYDFASNVTDYEVERTIEDARRRGVKVCLKPMLNCLDSMWRAYINFPDETMFGKDSYWSEWFRSYTAFLLHYAEIAERTGCEMLCIGCEMSGTERKEEYWREVVEKVRRAYSGKLVYNTNHGDEETVKWFDTLDYIGTSAYYPIAERGGESAQSMMKTWETVREKLSALSAKLNKKIIFMEIGCRSALGCATMPWDFSHREFPVNQDEQANFFESCLEVFHKEPWFEGVFWWDWSTKIYDTREEAARDKGFNIHLKKAEEVIKKYYAAS